MQLVNENRKEVPYIFLRVCYSRLDFDKSTENQLPL